MGATIAAIFANVAEGPMSSRPVMAAGLAVMMMVLTACGTARPGTDELAAGMTTGNSLFPIAEQYSECAAGHLLASDLDDDLLHAIAQSDTAYELDARQSSLLASLQVEVLTTCAAVSTS